MDEKEKSLFPENEQEKEEIAVEEILQEEKATDGLSQELNELKELFQQELDKATEKKDEQQEAAEGETEEGELIQELSYEQEENEEEPSEEAEQRICTRCGEKPCSTKEGQDCPYCDDCYAFVKKSPMRISGFIAALVMTVVFFATAFTSVSSFDESLFMAYYHQANGDRYSAIDSGIEYLNKVGNENASVNGVRRLIDDYCKAGYVSDAASLIKKHFSEAELKMPWNKKYRTIAEETEVHIKTYQAVSQVAQPALSGEEFDYNEVMAELKKIRETTDEDGKKIYADMFIDIVTVDIMNKSGVSVEDQLELLMKVQKENKHFEGIYLPAICSAALRAGDKELVESCFKKMKKNNAQDMNAYIYYASYFRYLDTPDADKMIEICTEAAAHAYSGDLSYKPTLALAYLLKGEGSLALQEMDEFMAMSRRSVGQCNLYALAGLYNGNEDIYEEMKALLEGYGYELSELVEKYKSGEMEIKEVLADKGGNIG